MAKEKKIQVNTFENGANSDAADFGVTGIPPSQARFFLNCGIYDKGYRGNARNRAGNVQIPNILPAGINQCLGWASDEADNLFYWINYNSNGNHGIYQYNDSTGVIIPVILNLTQTNNVDIFNLGQNNRVNHFDIIKTNGNNLGYWVDGRNKARKTNLTKAQNGGYGSIIFEDYITAYKKTAPFPIVPVYTTDITNASNYLYGQQFKFAQRLLYDDGEESNVNDFSKVPLPPGESFTGQNSITYNNNCINVPVFTGNELVTDIEILVQILTTDNTNGLLLPWQRVIILNKAQLSIPDNTYYTFAFYNNLPLTPVDNVKVNRPYSYLPDIPNVQSFVKLAMTYGNFPEGKPTYIPNANVVVTSQNLFIPSGTAPQLNSPSFIISQTSATFKSAGFLAGGWVVVVNHFIVGFDVKKGNIFNLAMNNGQSDHSNWSVPAGYGDTSQTIGAKLKADLRSIGRGVPDFRNGISNEAIDGFGNVSWDYTYLGRYGETATIFTGFVNPVNYSTLMNDGTSTNVIKSGGPRKYAIVLEDSDGRKFGAYTVNGLLAITPFITQWGTTILQQPIHTISIFSLPPPWAFAWYLARTSDITGEIQMLIQNVTQITVVGEGTYLDLIIGSLYTYQLIHPDTVIKYQFQRGDRVRLIKNETTGALYPYFDTEVLRYLETEEQIMTASIVCDGSANVTPGDGVKTAFVGKNIIINGAERNIVSISGSQYVLNEPINPNLANPTIPTTSATYPNYTIIDRRGIIRINLPPANITLAAYSLIEIYHPQANAEDAQTNDQYQNFQECGIKFPIINPGTPQAAFVGNVNNSTGTPNQDPTNPTGNPAIVQVTQGEAYFRNRFMPTNVPQDPSNPNDVQGIIDTVEDPNFSDFYASNLYNLGRVYPQDQGQGMQIFDQRERSSNNFIQDTKINGLNDFDNTDRKDYNDQYGAINLSRFRRGYLFMFKALHTSWTPIKQKRILSNSGEVGLATSDDLFNDIEYATLEVGIGNNPESWFESDEHQYFGSAASGVFVRIAQDGSIPISQLYNYDLSVRSFLTNVGKYKLPMPGGFDWPNSEAYWSYPPFIQYLFNAGFNPNQWNTALAAYPAGTTWTVTQQPANSTATVSGQSINITGTNTLGADYFLFRGNLPGGGTTPVFKQCFTVVAPADAPISWTQQVNTAYCIQVGGNNTGQQGWTILNQISQITGSLTGFNMPNIPFISPEAIIPNTSAITYNANTSPTPSGGSNGDLWYNFPVDNLYKKIGGVWTILNDRLANAFYVQPIQNTGACPVPTFYRVTSNYNVNISGITNGTCTGTPASLNSLSLTNGQQANAVYTTIGAGTVHVAYSGLPGIPGHTYFQLLVGGVVQDTQLVAGGSTTLTFSSSPTSPTQIDIIVITQ